MIGVKINGEQIMRRNDHNILLTYAVRTKTRQRRNEVNGSKVDKRLGLLIWKLHICRNVQAHHDERHRLKDITNVFLILTCRVHLQSLFGQSRPVSAAPYKISYTTSTNWRTKLTRGSLSTRHTLPESLPKNDGFLTFDISLSDKFNSSYILWNRSWHWKCKIIKTFIK